MIVFNLICPSSLVPPTPSPPDNGRRESFKPTPREYKGVPFVFREDGYFNMTKAAASFGKDVRDFLYADSTNAYTNALSKCGKFPQLIQTKPGRYGGTFGHPKIAIRFAQWLDPEFAVWCDAVIEDILTKKADLVVTQPEASTVVATSKAGVGLDMASQLAQAVGLSMITPTRISSDDGNRRSDSQVGHTDRCRRSGDHRKLQPVLQDTRGENAPNGRDGFVPTDDLSGVGDACDQPWNQDCRSR